MTYSIFVKKRIGAVVILPTLLVLLLPMCRPVPVRCTPLSEANVIANLATHIRFLTDPAVESQRDRIYRYLASVLRTFPVADTPNLNASDKCFYIDIRGAKTPTRYVVNTDDPFALAVIAELGARAHASALSIQWGWFDPARSPDVVGSNPVANLPPVVAFMLNGCGDGPFSTDTPIAAHLPSLPPQWGNVLAEWAETHSLDVAERAKIPQFGCFAGASVVLTHQMTRSTTRRCHFAEPSTPIVSWLTVLARFSEIAITTREPGFTDSDNHPHHVQ